MTTTIGGDLTVTGNTSLLGNTDIGNADTDTVTFTAVVDSAILPDATANNRDLGSTLRLGEHFMQLH